jgi:hypothetical protein
MVGRNAEFENILARLGVDGGSVAVIGLPRIGKTSLAKDIYRRLVETDPLSIRLWIDLSTISESRPLFQILTDEFVNTLSNRDVSYYDSIKKLIATSTSDSYEAYRLFKRVLVIAAKAGLKAQLFIDEFDAIKTFSDAMPTVQRLRDLVYNQAETGLCGVFIARRSLRTLELSIADVSTLDGVCEQQYLGPLDSRGLAELLDRSAKEGWVVSEEDSQLLHFYTGGHPYLAEMVLCRAWSERSVAKGAVPSLGDIFDYYEHVRKILEEDGLFDQLLQIAVGPRFSLRAGSVERLLRFGVLRTTGQGGCFRAWADHYQSYLEKCVRDAPLISLWKETEISVRNFVSAVYSGALGAGWIDILRRRHKNLGAIINRCDEMMKKERENFGHSESVTVLYYTYPMELWEFVTAEWPLFRGQLGRTKDYWSQRFAHLSKVRTPTAHNRDIVLAPHEIKLAEAYCEELISIISSPSVTV